MQIFSTLAVIFVFALTILQCDNTGVKSNQNAAQNTSQKNSTVAATTPDDGAPRITLEDAKKDFDAGGVIFIDTRAEVQYKLEHIKGAINIPVEGFEARASEVPQDKKIIAYCS